MKNILAVAFIGFGFAFAGLAGCNKSGGAGGGSNSSTTSGQNCMSTHMCVNGACNCGLDPMNPGPSCPDATTCETQCKVCTGG